MGAELDREELMHLALYAANHEKPQEAIGHLKQLLELDANNGKALYLLGALHAEIGMQENAIQEIELALKNDPLLPPTAAFQLGLLHLTSGEVSKAEQAWRPLVNLDEADPLSLFRAGMMHLVKDEFAECVEKLGRGIHKNNLYEDLNADMYKVLKDAEAAMRNQSAPTTEPDRADREPPRSRLTIYEQDID